jgi:acetyl-CoA carboxylase carboxyltransferase component
MNVTQGNQKGTEMKKLIVLRQGDVLLTRVASIPAGAKEANHAQDGIVLAWGEVTGHRHLVLTEDKAPKARMWDAGAERYLQVLETTALQHEEHAAIPLEPGVYKVVQQRQYAPQGIQNVSD